jgi:hypothetical protein
MKYIIVYFMFISVQISQNSQSRPTYLPDIQGKNNVYKNPTDNENKSNTIEDIKKNNAKDLNPKLNIIKQSPAPPLPIFPKFESTNPEKQKNKHEIIIKQSEPNINQIKRNEDLNHNSNQTTKKNSQQNISEYLKTEEEVKNISGPDLNEYVSPIVITDPIKNKPTFKPNSQALIKGNLASERDTKTGKYEKIIPNHSQLKQDNFPSIEQNENQTTNDSPKNLLPILPKVNPNQPSASEPRSMPEELKETIEPYEPVKKTKHWNKHNSKLSFEQPVIDCLRSDIFKNINVKIYEKQELTYEPKVLIKPIFNVLPIIETEVTYREEKRKVIIMVPKEKEEERLIQSVNEVEELVFDEASGKNKKVVKQIPVTSTIIVKCIELVPEEFETTVKIPVFTQKNSSITIQTFTGIMGTEPTKITTMDMIKNKMEGSILTPNPKLNNPDSSSPNE